MVIQSQRSWCQMKDNMHVAIYDNCNYLSIRNHFIDIVTFLSKKFIPSHVTRIYLMTPRVVKFSAHDFMEFFLSKPEVSIFKNVGDMANLKKIDV